MKTKTQEQLEKEIEEKESFINAGGFYDRENRLEESEKECLNDTKELKTKLSQHLTDIKNFEGSFDKLNVEKLKYVKFKRPYYKGKEELKKEALKEL